MQANAQSSGRVSSLAVGQFNGQPVLYAGFAGGGVWRSSVLTTQPLSWTALTDTPPGFSPSTGVGAGAIDVGSIAVSGSNVYDGTGEANYGGDTRYGTGVMVSGNGGATWSSPATGTPTNPTAFFPNSISKIINPGPNTLYAAVVPPLGYLPNAGLPGRPGVPQTNPATWGVYQSLDNGTTWTQITGLPNGSVITDLDYMTINGQTVLLAAAGNITGDANAGNNGVYTGTPDGKGGFTWAILPIAVRFPSGTAVGRISLASDHTSTFYAAFSTPANAGDSSLQGVYRAVWNNATSTWTGTNVTPPGVTDGQTFYNLAIGLSPVTNRVYLGLQNTIWESNPGVSFWANIGMNLGGTSPHVDTHAFAFGSDGTVYVGTDGGIFAYTPPVYNLPSTIGLVGSKPVAIATDLLINTDPLPDIAVLNQATDDVTVFLSVANNPLNFTWTRYLLGNSPSNAAAMLVEDLNKSKGPDIAVADSAANVTSVLLNNGDGTFPKPPPYPPIYGGGTKPTSIGVADFQDDGKLDLALPNINSNPGGFAILTGDGTGGFAAPVTVSPTTLNVTALAAGDLNGDGFGDVVLTTYNASTGAGNVLVFMNNAGTLPAAPTATIALPPWSNPTSVLLGSVRGAAGKYDDVIVTDSGTNSVSVILNNDDGTFKAANTYAAGPNPVAAAVGDFNADNMTDIVVANNQAAGLVSILYQTPTGFQAPISYPSGGKNPSSVAVADFNQDLLPDIVVANSGSDNIAFLLSNTNVPKQNLAPAWTDLNTAPTTGTPLNTNQLNSAAQMPGSFATLLEGSQDNGIALVTSAAHTVVPWTLNGVSGDGGMVRFDPNDPVGGMTNYAYAMNQYGYIYRSDDGGSTFIPKLTGLGAGVGGANSGFPFLTKFAIDPNAGSPNLLLGSNGPVYQTTNRGDSWAPLPTTGLTDTSGITALAYAPSNDQTIYVGYADGGLVRTDNGGTNWTGLGKPLATNPITSIAVNPTNPAFVYISGGTFNTPQVAVSGNSGATFIDFTGNGIGGVTAIPNVPVNALLLDSTGATLYAGTDMGVYYTAATARNWAAFGTGLPNVQVLDLQMQTFTTGTFLVTATHGRGAWRVDPPAGPPSDDSGTGKSTPAANVASQVVAAITSAILTIPPNLNSVNGPTLPLAPAVVGAIDAGRFNQATQALLSALLFGNSSGPGLSSAGAPNLFTDGGLAPRAVDFFTLYATSLQGRALRPLADGFAPREDTPADVVLDPGPTDTDAESTETAVVILDVLAPEMEGGD